MQIWIALLKTLSAAPLLIHTMQTNRKKNKYKKFILFHASLAAFIDFLDLPCTESFSSISCSVKPSLGAMERLDLREKSRFPLRKEDYLHGKNLRFP